MSLLDTFVQVFEFDTRQADAAFDQFRRSTDDMIADMQKAQQAAEAGSAGFGQFVQGLAASLQEMSGGSAIDIDVDLHESQEKLTSVREKISELEAALATLDSQREQAGLGLQDNGATLTQLTAQYDLLQGELASLNGELDSLTEAEQKNAKAKEAVNAIVGALQADYAKFVATMRTQGIQAAMDEAKAQHQLQQALAETESQYHIAGESVEDFASQVLEAMGSVANTGGIDLDIDLHESQEKLVSVREKIGELEATLATLDNQRAQADLGFQDSGTTVTELTEQYNQLQGELSTLNGELDSLTAAEKKNAKAKAAVNAIVESLQADYAKFVATMRTQGIQAAIDEAKAQNKLQQALTDTESKYKSAGESVAGFATKALAAAGIVTSIGGIFSDAVSRSQEIEALDKLGKKIGIATEDVDAFGGALTELGGSRDAAQADLEAMSQSFGKTTNKMEKILATADKVKGMKFDKAKATLAGLGVSDDKTVELMMKGRKELERVMGIQKEYSGITKESIDKSIQFNAAMNKFQQSSGLLKNSFLEMVIPILAKATDWLSRFVGFCKENKTLIIGFFMGIGLAVATLYVPPMLAAAATTLATALPIIAIAALVGLLAAAFALVYDDIMNFIEGNDSMIGRILDKYPMLKKIVMMLWEAWKILFDYLKTAVKFVTDVVVTAFNYMDEKISEFINWLLGTVASLTAWGSQFSGVFDTVSDAIVGAFTWMWDQVKKVIGWIGDGLDAVSKGISSVKGWFGFGSDNKVNLEQNVEQKVTQKDAEQYLDVLASKRKNAQESGMDTKELDKEIIALRQQLADGKNAADVVAGVEAANKKLMDASNNPMNPVTSQAISNQSHQTNETNTQIGEITITTQATDAQGISKDMKGELSNQLKDLGQQTATGVAK